MKVTYRDDVIQFRDKRASKIDFDKERVFFSRAKFHLKESSTLDIVA